jgi:hypothetical protein
MKIVWLYECRPPVQNLRTVNLPFFGELRVVGCVLLFQFLFLWPQVKGCVKLLKEQPAARSEGLLNALRWVKYLFVEWMLVQNEVSKTLIIHRRCHYLLFMFLPASATQIMLRQSVFHCSISSCKHFSCICVYSFPPFFYISVSLGVSTLSLVFIV